MTSHFESIKSNHREDPFRVGTTAVIGIMVVQRADRESNFDNNQFSIMKEACQEQ